MGDVVTKKQSTLTMLNESAPCSLEEIRAQHQGKWLFIEITAMDEDGDATEGRLIAVADEEIDLAELGSDAAQRNIPVALLHANYDEVGMDLSSYYAKRLALLQIK